MKNEIEEDKKSIKIYSFEEETKKGKEVGKKGKEIAADDDNVR